MKIVDLVIPMNRISLSFCCDIHLQHVRLVSTDQGASGRVTVRTMPHVITYLGPAHVDLDGMVSCAVNRAQMVTTIWNVEVHLLVELVHV